MNNLRITKKDVERYAVFLFGVVFLVAILCLLVLIPKPTLAQFFAFRLTMALAAGGIGAFIPGFIHFEQPLISRGIIRCGGAVALFAAVWFTNPAKFAIDGISPPPPDDARLYIENFLAAGDEQNLSKAYSMLSKREQTSVSLASYIQLVGNVRAPLGTRLIGPILSSTSNPEEIPGRRGPFFFASYQSLFSGKPGVWVEITGAVAEEGKWKIHTYVVAPCLPPVCQTLDKFK